MLVDKLRPYVKICVPCYDVKTWMESVGKASYDTMVMQRETSKEVLPFDFTYGFCQGTVIEQSRNALIQPDLSAQAVRQKLDAPFSHYLFLDHDVAWSVNDLLKLLADNKPIVSGCYRPKHQTDIYVAGYYDEHCRIQSHVLVSDTGKGLIKVGWVGGGFLLVTKEALEKMTYPWFWKTVHYYSNRALCVGEDIFFCKNAENNLLDVWLDTDVVLNHEANRNSVSKEHRKHAGISDPIIVA